MKINYIPDAFGVGVTIPIPKSDVNRKAMNSDNFRGITISPVISMVFENCYNWIL
jgi:hypothetical protein